MFFPPLLARMLQGIRTCALVTMRLSLLNLLVVAP
jgi:hypothetical protein